MTRSPPLIAVRAFEAAARHLSFKAAADELHVTPTAISHQIRVLEKHVGVSLFRRRPQPLALTDAGVRLFPAIHASLNSISAALAALGGNNLKELRVTTTSAFAARWLLPHLPRWRKLHRSIALDIIGTYNVLDLEAGEADIAIRYARHAPKDGSVTELARDTFHVVGSPVLLGRKSGLLTPKELARLPLIETGWPPKDRQAPTWAFWERTAGKIHAGVPRLSERISFRFEEEMHAIDAVLAGQGIAICSDVLIRRELQSGKLRRISDVSLPGFGFYLVHLPHHPKSAIISAFKTWLQALM